jgi:hypothetical protein
MEDFANAFFPPDLIKVMKLAMDGALSTLPHPVSSRHVQSAAETAATSSTRMATTS